ncbi:MAG: hypothetical protein KAI14_03555 [Dehalococcoidales bacterium]|nr:hypothetical protein [Dehalococcoidales bacterium]
MEIPLISKVVLYIIIVLFGLICIPILRWQIMVLRGKSMKNPDGSADDWHEQKLFYGIALADITIAIPVAIIGITLIFVGWRIGYYLTGLACFWFLWANVMATATSLRFENPKITLNWFIVFPFGAVLGLAYIVWTLVHFDTVFLS